MADSIIPKKDMFPKVAEARELLKAKALEMAERYEKAVIDAMAAGEYEVAIKAMQWFIEHAPSHNGVTIIDSGIDVTKTQDKNKGPRIQIGIKLGGNPNGNPGDSRTLPFNQPQSLPIEVIDVEPDPDSKS